jgi:hypothetical protein
MIDQGSTAAHLLEKDSGARIDKAEFLGLRTD